MTKEKLLQTISGLIDSEPEYYFDSLNVFNIYHFIDNGKRQTIKRALHECCVEITFAKLANNVLEVKTKQSFYDNEGKRLYEVVTP